MKRQDLAYVIETPLGGSSAKVRFTGLFQGKPVTWLARLQTLKHYDHECRLGSSAAHNQIVERRSFIRIEEPLPEGVALTVCLDVEKIDEPTVLKTIVMIRNYKRLSKGLHEFGEPRQFP